MTPDPGSVDPPSPAVGSVVELMRAGGRQAFAEASVCARSDTLLVVSTGPVAHDQERLTLRWWDENDEAWDVTVAVAQFDAASSELTLQLLAAWRPAVLRRAARVTLGREPAELLTLGGDGRVVRRVNVLCLDLSTTGCRVTGTGPPPTGGDALRVAASTPDVRVLVDARIVHIARVAFGGWQAGIEFLPHDSAERAGLIEWRDSASS
jgi:hypothetical protein